MPSDSPDQDQPDSNLFLRLSTSTSRSFKNNTFTSHNLSFEPYEELKGGHCFGNFSWPSGATYEGEFSDGSRNGHGKQTWQDGSIYEGDFANDMRHGYGVHKWISGEVYEGQFYKDHRHGKGSYTWPDGTKYVGTFYLDRKEGYGTFTFSNGDKFEGLYKADERFGPGVMSYNNLSDHGHDVGIWHREKILKLCISANDAFTMEDHPEYEYFSDEHHSQIDLSSMEDRGVHSVFVKESSSYVFLSEEFKSSLFAENTALPPGIETYSKDFEHLPLTSKHKEDLDRAFFGSDYDLVKNDDSSFLIATNNTPLMMEVQKHIYKYRHAAKSTSFDVASVASSKRTSFKSKSGYLEIMSQTLIEMATAGDMRMVYSILKADLVDPNVADCHGNMALIGAAMNCHHEIVNLLLDMGANVNQVTDEGVSALSACHVFYYPLDHFKFNIGESSVEQFRNKEKKEKKTQPKKRRGTICEKSKVAQHRIKRALSPDRRFSMPVAVPANVKVKGTSNKSQSKDDVTSNLTQSPTGLKQDIETCKSDVRIMKAHRRIMSAKSLGQSNEVRSLKFEQELDGDDIVSNTTDTDVSADKPTFDSNQNMVEFDLAVTDDLIERTATLLSLNQRAISGVSTRDGRAMKLGTAGALAVWKAEHSQLRSMIKLLLRRGGNPNVGTVPFPTLFFAVKAGDVEAVQFLLEKGALTSHRLSDKLGGLTPLHIASGIVCPEGAKIVELLLNASADPNMAAHDEEISHSTGTGSSDSGSTSNLSTHSNKWMETGTQWVTEGLKFIDETGRTALHIACDRDDNYKYARDITHLLLENGANPDVIWSGHSPLSLAVCSGNDLCIDELLQAGADASLPLTRGVGSVLCVAADPKHEHRRSPDGRIKLVDKLVRFGANILAPISYGVKQVTGTVIDYAHWMFLKDTRIAHTPYHALTISERETYTARKQLLAHMGMLLRDAAVTVERTRLKQEFKHGIKSHSPSRDGRFLYTGAGAEVSTNSLMPGTVYPLAGAQEASWVQEATVSRVSFVPPNILDQKQDFGASGIISAQDTNKGSQLSSKTKKRRRSSIGPIRKPLFRYCYDCGRSVGVRLTSCSRCHEVFYCSRACKIKAWEDIHKDECTRLKAFREESPIPTSSEIAALFAEQSLDDTMKRAQMKSNSIIDTILNQHLLVAEENVMMSQRTMYGSRATTARKSASRSRCLESPAKSRRAFSSRTAKESGRASTRGGTSQNPAKVSARTRAKVGKDVTFGTTGMTLAEMGITENYSFE